MRRKRASDHTMTPRLSVSSRRVGSAGGALIGPWWHGRMGPPGYDHTYEGRRSLGYSETWTETVFQPGGRGLFQELTRRCEVIFAMDDGRVAGFRTRGGACDWAGQ